MKRPNHKRHTTNHLGNRPGVKRLTLKKVNKALADLGVEERLSTGSGCYFFHRGNAVKWKTTVVLAYQLNYLTLEQWLSEWLLLSGNDKFPSSQE